MYQLRLLHCVLQICGKEVCSAFFATAYGLSINTLTKYYKQAIKGLNRPHGNTGKKV
jgi:hypothetical protein